MALLRLYKDKQEEESQAPTKKSSGLIRLYKEEPTKSETTPIGQPKPTESDYLILQRAAQKSLAGINKQIAEVEARPDKQFTDAISAYNKPPIVKKDGLITLKGFKIDPSKQPTFSAITDPKQIKELEASPKFYHPTVDPKAKQRGDIENAMRAKENAWQIKESKEYTDLQAAKSMIEDFINTPEGQTNWWKDIKAAGRELSRNADYLPIAGSLKGGANLYEDYKLSKKLANNELLTSAEQANLERLKSEQLPIQRGWPYGVVKILGQFPAFAGEFALSGGTATAVKKATEVSIKKAVGKTIEKKVVSLVTRAIGTTVGTTVASLTNPARIAKYTIDYQNPSYQLVAQDDSLSLAISKEGDSFEKALVKAIGVNAVEYVTERLGDGLTIGKDESLKLLEKTFIGKFLKKKGAKTASEALAKFKDVTGFNGIINEIIEEEAAEALQAPIEERDYFNPITTPEGRDRLLTEAIAFGIIGVGYKGAGVLTDTKTPTIIRKDETPPPPGPSGPSGKTQEIKVEETLPRIGTPTQTNIVTEGKTPVEVQQEVSQNRVIEILPEQIQDKISVIFSGLATADKIESLTPLGLQHRWEDATSKLQEEVIDPLTAQVEALEKQVEALGKSRDPKVKELKAKYNLEIESLRESMDKAQGEIQRENQDFQYALADYAIKRAKEAGIDLGDYTNPLDGLTEKAQEFRDEIVQRLYERPYIETNYKQTTQQIIDDYIVEFGGGFAQDKEKPKTGTIENKIEILTKQIEEAVKKNDQAFLTGLRTMVDSSKDVKLKEAVKEALIRATANLKPKTQKEKVAEVVKEKPKSIQEVARATGILEPNVRRILGVGAKEGTFERVAEGVYVLSKDGQDIAYIQAGDSLKVLPELVNKGFKADMIFLDIPYKTPATVGGNRGINYDYITPDQFGTFLESVNKITRTDNTPVVYMFSQAPSGLKVMQQYTDKFIDNGFQPIARGFYQKTYASGKPVAFPTRAGSKVVEPEGIILWSKSGKSDKVVTNTDLQYTFVRPTGYQTEKPAALMKSLIEFTTEEGGVVFDPFTGSGVTPAEAVKAGRKAVAIEKDERVVEELIKPRVEAAVKEAKKFKSATEFEEAVSSIDSEANLENVVQFHGTQNGEALRQAIEDGTVRGSAQGIIGKGFYLTTSKEAAEMFGKQVYDPTIKARTGVAKAPDIIPIDLRGLNIKTQPFGKQEYFDFLETQGLTSDQYNEQLSSEGFDGLNLEGRGETIIFDPKKIKIFSFETFYSEAIKAETQEERTFEKGNIVKITDKETGKSAERIVTNIHPDGLVVIRVDGVGIPNKVLFSKWDVSFIEEGKVPKMGITFGELARMEEAEERAKEFATLQEGREIPKELESLAEEARQSGTYEKFIEVQARKPLGGYKSSRELPKEVPEVGSILSTTLSKAKYEVVEVVEDRLIVRNTLSKDNRITIGFDEVKEVISGKMAPLVERPPTESALASAEKLLEATLGRAGFISVRDFYEQAITEKVSTDPRIKPFTRLEADLTKTKGFLATRENGENKFFIKREAANEYLNEAFIGKGDTEREEVRKKRAPRKKKDIKVVEEPQAPGKPWIESQDFNEDEKFLAASTIEMVKESEAGYRFTIPGQGSEDEYRVSPSTFPDFLPSRLRLKTLVRAASAHLENGTVPKKLTTREGETYTAIKEHILKSIKNSREQQELVGQELFIGKGGSAGANIGTFQDGTPILAGNLEQIKPIEMPELVRLARQLTGEAPKVRENMGKKLGFFRPRGAGQVFLKADLFKPENQEQLAKTLAHEIGHLVDYLPDRTMKRGNLLGRLLTLREFRKTIFDVKEGEGVDLKELRNEAMKEVLEETGHTFGEMVSGELPLKVRDQIKERYKAKIAELETISNQEIKDELTKVTEYWRPYDKAQSDANYLAYRKQGKEMYADALSMLFNSPGLLQQMAPTFYKNFFEKLDAKPEVKKAYFELQELLNGSTENLLKARELDVLKGFAKAEDMQKQFAEEKELQRKSLWEALRRQVDDINYPILKRQKALEADGVVLAETENPKFILQEESMADNENFLLVHDIQEKIVAPIEAKGISTEDLGQYLLLDRIRTGRADIANPFGFNPANANTQIDFIKQRLGEENFALLQEKAKIFHDLVFKSVEEAVKVGSYNLDTFLTRILPNKDNYAAFQVVDYLQDRMPAGVKGQVGTLKEVANPFISTLLKTVALNRLNAYQRAKNATIKLLEQTGEIEKSKRITSDGKLSIFKVAPGKGGLEVLENGRLTSYDVDPYIAESFQKDKIGDLNAIVNLVNQFNNKFFKPLVTTYNLGFAAAFNPIRDFRRNYKNINNATVGGLLKAYVQSLGQAAKFSKGQMDEFTRSLVESKAINAPIDDYNFDWREDEFGRQLVRFGIVKEDAKVSAVKKVLLAPVLKTLQGIRFVANTFEIVSKIAGAKVRIAGGEQGKQLSYNLRNYTGTPNFRVRGKQTNTTNAIFVFSNVMKEGMKTDFQIATNPNSRAGYWWKTVKIDILPKTLMIMASSGLLGLVLEDFFDKIPEYDKANYIIIPVGYHNGKPMYIRIPHDETGRLISATYWKMAKFAGTGETKNLQDIFAFGAGQIPSVSPAISITSNWIQYLSGRNPYDAFRGRTLIDDTTWEAGGGAALKKMVEWTLNSTGLTRFATYDTSQNTSLETFIQTAPWFSRVLKISDYGTQEKAKEIQGEVRQDRAQQTLGDRKLITKYVEKFKNLPTKLGATRLETELIKEVLGHLPKNEEERSRATGLKQKFRRARLKGTSDTRMDTLIDSRSNQEKIELLRAYKGTMQSAEYLQFKKEALKDGVISSDVYSSIK